MLVSDAERILGVSADASEQDIKSAYKRASLRTHPDKGGTAEGFQEVAEAFMTLTEPPDTRFEEAAPATRGAAADMRRHGARVNPFEIFEQMFGVHVSPTGEIAFDVHRFYNGDVPLCAREYIPPVGGMISAPELRKLIASETQARPSEARRLHDG